ncbi:Tat pathway signal sequence domain protein [Streptomyces fructofermentans]
MELSGVGPVEPGENTHELTTGPDLSGPVTGRPGPPPSGHLGHSGRLDPSGRLGRLGRLVGLQRFYDRHRRAVLASASAVGLLAGGGYLLATRPEEPPPPPDPLPSQVVDVAYLGVEPPPAGARSGSFSFAVRITVRSGPTVTVVRVSQPYAALSLTSLPGTPFRTKTGFGHKIVVTMHVTECANVPSNAGLPFLEVTLRNTRAIQDHSFILGEQYAHDLSEALQVACSNELSSRPKP